MLDAQADRLDENLASIAELRESLGSYGQSLAQIPVVIQYNKRDLGEPFSIEALHRRVGLPEAAVFETIATEHSGVLQVLTTLSKSVVRILRETAQGEPSHSTMGPSTEPLEPDFAMRDALESGILDEGTEGEGGDLMMQSTQTGLGGQLACSQRIARKEQTPSCGPLQRPENSVGRDRPNHRRTRTPRALSAWRTSRAKVLGSPSQSPLSRFSTRTCRPCTVRPPGPTQTVPHRISRGMPQSRYPPSPDA